MKIITQREIIQFQYKISIALEYYKEKCNNTEIMSPALDFLTIRGLCGRQKCNKRHVIYIINATPTVSVIRTLLEDRSVDKCRVIIEASLAWGIIAYIKSYSMVFC